MMADSNEQVCKYCSNLATKTLVWLKDKRGQPARISLPYCGCDLMTALRKIWRTPYQVVEGVDYEIVEAEIQSGQAAAGFEAWMANQFWSEEGALPERIRRWSRVAWQAATQAAEARHKKELESLKERLRLALAPAVAEVCLKPSRQELQGELEKLQQRQAARVAEFRRRVEHLKARIRGAHAQSDIGALDTLLIIDECFPAERPGE